MDMSNNRLNYDEDHYCPVYGRVISADLCYDSFMCLNRCFKVASTKELSEIEDIEVARRICAKCQYSSN